MPLMAFWTILICIIDSVYVRLESRKVSKSFQVHDDSTAFDHDRTCDPFCDDERCRSRNSFYLIP